MDELAARRARKAATEAAARAATRAAVRVDVVVERARLQAEARMAELTRLHRVGRRTACALVGAALLLVITAIGSIAVVMYESRVELAATRAALDRSARAHGKALSDLLERRTGVTSDSVRARE